MEGMRFIQTIRLENILSFGPDTPELPLEPLNVLIGPNASGKSNLIEALAILQAAPSDIQEPIREGGGIRNWLWKGTAKTPNATIDLTLSRRIDIPLRYRLSFTDRSSRFAVVDEVIEDERPRTADAAPYFYYRHEVLGPLIKFIAPPEGDAVKPPVQLQSEDRLEIRLTWEDVQHDQSILSQRRDSQTYPELGNLGTIFSFMRFYRELNLGRDAPARLPQRPDLPQNYLLEDASNLSLVLSDLLNRPTVKRELLERLRDFNPAVEDMVASVSGGTVQLFFHEKGLRHPVPATRLSDGSLRYLCLLAVLCHPELPRVICIEEPELGLHPDVIPEVAKLLVKASSRSQIFVTTHSDILVDALSDVPEAVIVCEKRDGATQLRRLDPERLKPWLEEYRLGEMWTRGEIGGNRW